MDLSWPEQTYLTINTFINDCGWFSFEKLSQNFGFRVKTGLFEPQISPSLSPGDNQNDKNHMYMDISWPEQTYLTINTFINDCGWFSYEKLSKKFGFRVKTGLFDHQISPSLSPGGQPKC